MKEKFDIKLITESIELAKKLEKKNNRNFLWFLLFPIIFGLGWFYFSISSINKINVDKEKLSTLLEERDSSLLVIQSLTQEDPIMTPKDSTINAVVISTLKDDDNYNNNWGIITCADNSLPAAEWELTRLKKIGIENASIFYRKGFYRTIVFPLTKGKSNDLLKILKAKINSSAYIVNVSSWCLNRTKKQNYYDCQE